MDEMSSLGCIFCLSVPHSTKQRVSAKSPTIFRATELKRVSLLWCVERTDYYCVFLISLWQNDCYTRSLNVCLLQELNILITVTNNI